MTDSNLQSVAVEIDKSSDTSPYQGSHLEALIRGLARWDRALEKDPERLKRLENSHIAIDSDIPRYFTTPSSMAGGIGLRYYGREYTVHPKERAAATALTSELGRWMIHELSSCGRNGRGQSLILFPSIASSISRSFEHSIVSTRSALIGAEAIRQRIETLLKEMAAEGDQEKLLLLVREFVSAYCGENTNESPVPLLELERFENIFDNGLLIHVSRYRFPELGELEFLPEFDEAETAEIRNEWAALFDKRLRLFPDGALNKPAMRKAGVTYNKIGDKTWARLADDADMMAWLDILNCGVWPTEDTPIEIPCVLVTGSSRIRTASRQHNFGSLIFEPIDFLPFLFFDENRHLTEETLKNLASFRDRLRSVLVAVWQAWDDDPSHESGSLDNYSAWRDVLAEHGSGVTSTAFSFAQSKLGAPQTIEYLQAVDKDWQDLMSTFAVADVNFRDEILSALETSLGNGNVELSNGLAKLVERVSIALDESFEYSNIILAREIVDAARNIPPVRLDVMGNNWSKFIQEIVRSRKRQATLSRDSLVTLRSDNPSLFDLVSGLTQCALNQWSLTAASNFRIDNLLQGSNAYEIDTERLFCAAVVKRVASTDVQGLLEARKLIQTCRSNVMGDPFFRLEAEEISNSVAELWLTNTARKSENYDISAKYRREQFCRAHELLSLLLDEPQQDHDHFIRLYVIQQLSVNCLQLALLDKYIPLLPDKERPTLEIIPRQLAFQVLADQTVNIQGVAAGFQNQCRELSENNVKSFRPVVSNFVRATLGVSSAEFATTTLAERTTIRNHLERMCRQPPAVTKIDPTRYPFYLKIVERRIQAG